MNAILAILAPAAAILGLTELPPQQLQPGQCRTFLWLKQEPPFRIAMIDDGARTMRMQRGQQMFDMAETTPGHYEGHGYRAVATLHFAASGNITDGAIVDSGALRIERTEEQAGEQTGAAGEAMSFPVGGMRACQ